jgi:hypothetical protein
MPDQLDPEGVATLRRLLDSPTAGHQGPAIMGALEHADEVASAAPGKPPVERFQLVRQAAVGLLEGIGLALAEDEGKAQAKE